MNSFAISRKLIWSEQLYTTQGLAMAWGGQRGLRQKQVCEVPLPAHRPGGRVIRTPWHATPDRGGGVQVPKPLFFKVTCNPRPGGGGFSFSSHQVRKDFLVPKQAAHRRTSIWAFECNCSLGGVLCRVIYWNIFYSPYENHGHPSSATPTGGWLAYEGVGGQGEMDQSHQAKGGS